MNEWQYEGYPDSFHDVVCWCAGDGINWHKRVMYINEYNNWSEDYDVMCWIDVADPG